MTVMRIHDFPALEGAVLKAIYKKVKGSPKDGRWREFKGTIKIKGRHYEMECVFMLDETFLNIRQSKVKSNDNKIIMPSYINSPN